MKLKTEQSFILLFFLLSRLVKLKTQLFFIDRVAKNICNG